MLFENSLVIAPPGFGFNLDISSTTNFRSSSDKFNFSVIRENFFFENNSNSFSIRLIEFIIDSFSFFFLLS